MAHYVREGQHGGHDDGSCSPGGNAWPGRPGHEADGVGSGRVTALVPTAGVARPGARSLWDVAEACLAVAVFAVLCGLVFRASPYLPEPDDYAYRASIVAMTDGHVFTLTGAQAHALAVQ